MSELVDSTPPCVSEKDEKSEPADITEKMANVKIVETFESAQQLSSTEKDVTSDNVGENGEERFHTPETVNEQHNDDDAKLDNDEIEDDPAYIPRKGRYYMHDSREADDEVEEEKRSSRADGAWKHDRYNERFQRPKTKKQIMTRYGFDIREGDSQDIELSRKKRTQEVKKEDCGEESTKAKKLPKRDTRQKQRSRYERAHDVTTKSRSQNFPKSEKQRTERGNSENRDKDRAASDGRGDEDDDDLRVGQRRRVRSEHRRERHDRVDVRVVRNVRGSRGGLSGHRMEKYQQTKERFERNRYRDQNFDRAQHQKEQHGEQRIYENHRRGAMRGTVRGAGNSYGLSRGQQARTVPASYKQHDSRDPIYHRDDAPPQRNTGFSPRDSGNFYDNRGGFSLRANYSGRARGAVSHSTRGGFGDVYPPRGFTGPKRYSEQRGEIMPPPGQMTVPPPIPPQHSFNIPRQPTDVVYFDPTQQPSRQPLPPREKKIIEIVPPSN